MIFYWEKVKTKNLFLKVSVIDSLNSLDLSVDMVAILTDWEAFTKADFSKTKVFDGRGVISSSNYSIGKV